MRRGTRILWLLAGALLIAAGIVALASPQETLAALAVFMGIAMLVSGMFNIVFFCTTHDYTFGAGWLLADGILTTLVAVLVLGNRWLAVSALPFVLGMWFLCAGIVRFLNALDIKKLGIRGWPWLMLIGVLETVGGFLSFLNPIATGKIMGILIGVLLILRGLGAVLMCFYSMHWHRT